MPRLVFATLLTAVAALLSGSVAEAAAAQSRLGARPAQIRTGDHLSGPERARLATHDFAKCVYDQKRAVGLRDYLATHVYSDEASDELDDLLITRCLSRGQLTVTDDLMRGAIYEVLYRKGGRLKRLSDFSQTPAINYGDIGEAATDEMRSGIRFRQFADCAVRANPSASKDLMKSRLLSNSEAEAFASLQVTFESCLIDGSLFQFSEPVMRGLVAETLYRLAVAESERLEGAE